MYPLKDIPISFRQRLKPDSGPLYGLRSGRDRVQRVESACPVIPADRRERDRVYPGPPPFEDGEPDNGVYCEDRVMHGSSPVALRNGVGPWDLNN